MCVQQIVESAASRLPAIRRGKQRVVLRGQGMGQQSCDPVVHHFYHARMSAAVDAGPAVARKNKFIYCLYIQVQSRYKWPLTSPRLKVASNKSEATSTDSKKKLEVIYKDLLGG